VNRDVQRDGAYGAANARELAVVNENSVVPLNLIKRRAG
jgi:hypothetical protein